MPCHGLAEQTCYFCSCQCLFTCCPHACTRVDTFHLHLQPSCSNAPCSLPPLYGLAGSIMELALEAVKSTNLVYYEDYQYTEVTAEGSSMAELPLVPASRTKKNYKEFFQFVSQISAADLQAIHVAFADGKLNIAALPDSVRPLSFMGEACRLQIVVEEKLWTSLLGSSATFATMPHR